MSRGCAIAVLGAAALAAAGCVERRLSITSEPSGARVYLNDRDVGATPVEVDFTWFGVYDVRLTKSGYEPLITSREAEPPLHEVPPFDLFALFVPGTKATRLDWHFELLPASNDPQALLQRADDMRTRMRLDESARSEPADGSPQPASDAPDASEAPEPQPVEPVEPGPVHSAPEDYRELPASSEPAASAPAPQRESQPAEPVPAPVPTPTGEPDYREVTPR